MYFQPVDERRLHRVRGGICRTALTDGCRGAPTREAYGRDADNVEVVVTWPRLPLASSRWGTRSTRRTRGTPAPRRPGSGNARAGRRDTRTPTPALPFSGWMLRAPKPRALPRGYPKAAVTVGQRIRRLRMDLGLRQSDLADRLGCTARSVSAWERDVVTPKACQWPTLRAILGEGIDPVAVDLPAQLRAARLRLGLTQKQLANLVGLHERTIRNGEQGRFRPARKTMSRLRQVLGDLRLAASD